MMWHVEANTNIALESVQVDVQKKFLYSGKHFLGSRYNSWPLIKLMPKGVVISFRFFSGKHLLPMAFVASGHRRLTLNAAAPAELAGPERGMFVCTYTLYCLQS